MHARSRQNPLITALLRRCQRQKSMSQVLLHSNKEGTDYEIFNDEDEGKNKKRKGKGNSRKLWTREV